MYESEVDVPVCLEDCFNFLFLHAEAACFAPLQFHLGSCVQCFSTQQKDRAWAALPQSQAQVAVLRKVARQLSSWEGKTLLPHRKVEMSK